MLFFTVPVPMCIPTNSRQGFSLSTSLPALTSCLFDYEVVSHCGLIFSFVVFSKRYFVLVAGV